MSASAEQRQDAPETVSSITQQPSRPIMDITAQASRMPPGSAILYPTPSKASDPDPVEFLGVIRVPFRGLYWVRARRRAVHGKLVLEIRLATKTE
jgi:hypothetical protein